MDKLSNLVGVLSVAILAGISSYNLYLYLEGGSNGYASAAVFSGIFAIHCSNVICKKE